VQGDHLNAIGVLGGIPIAIPRISFADPRPRHQGISRQSLVTLGRATLVEALVSLPEMSPEKMEFIQRQLEEEAIVSKHEVLIARGDIGVEALQSKGIEVKTMGRTAAEDPEFFLAAGAAGVIAVTRLDVESAEE
jgi:hypothetical protein